MGNKHEYSLLEVVMVRNNSDRMVKLVRIRNPWGNADEFTGDWSDDSKLWDTLPSDTRKRIHSDRDDGAFWMSFEYWIEHFHNFSVCLLPKNTYGGYVAPDFEWRKFC